MSMKQIYNDSFFKRKSTQNYLKGIIACLTFLFASQNSVNAQVSTYGFTQSTGAFTPITGTVLETATGNTSTTSLNSNVYAVSLPFNFTFNATSYSSLNVTTNGFITFGTTAPTATNTSPISGTATYDGAVSVWGRDLNSVFDLNSVTGNISWETVGTAPNREVVIQWKNFRPAYSVSTTAAYAFSFQIRLQETSNVIKMVYDSGAFLAGTTGASTTAQIGLRGAANTDFNNRLNATTLGFMNSNAGTANSSTQASHTSSATPGMPSVGFTYTWTPPTCWVPNGVNVTGTTTTSATVNWLAPTIAPASGYDVYYSTTNTAPTSSTSPNISNVSGLSTPIGPLQNSTNYYVWVRSSCSSTDKSNWTAVTNFATQCNPLPGAYSEDFEAYPGVTNGAAGGVLPTCWNNLGTAQGGHVSNSTSSVVSGTKGLYLWTSGTTYIAYVALPAMSTLQSGNYKLKFDAKASVTANGILQIGYLDTTSTFVQLTTFSVPTSGTVYPFSFDIPALPAGVTQLALKNLGTPANSLSIDNLSYELQTLSTSEVLENKTLKIYPNPFTDNVNISDVEKIKTISVIDVSGRVLKTIENISSNINLSDLKAGLYLLNVQYKDGSKSSHKLIKK